MPKYIASDYAASLPLGSIIPYIIFYMDILSFASKSADVPPIYPVVLEVKTYMYVFSQSKFKFSTSYKTTRHVIILVRLATYLYTLSYLANISSPVSILNKLQLLADTNGAGLSRLKCLVIAFRKS